MTTRPVARISQQGGPKTKRGPQFQNIILDVCSNRGAKDFKWGAGHHWTPAGDDPSHNTGILLPSLCVNARAVSLVNNQNSHQGSHCRPHQIDQRHFGRICATVGSVLALTFSGVSSEQELDRCLRGVHGRYIRLRFRLR